MGSTVLFCESVAHCIQETTLVWGGELGWRKEEMNVTCFVLQNQPKNLEFKIEI